VREIRLVREAGALTVLPLALRANIVARIFAGELAAAASSIDEVKIAVEATGSRPRPTAPWPSRPGEVGRPTSPR
jgi:hypothetical protein